MFYEGTAVLLAEVFKLIACLLLVLNEEQYNIKKYLESLYNTIWVNKTDTFKVI